VLRREARGRTGSCFDFVDLLFSLLLNSVTKSSVTESSVAGVVSLEHCNVWGLVKSNHPSVNKYAHLTRHSSSLLDLDRDIGCPIIGLSLSA